MRTLTPSEIKRLGENRCHAEDWQKITVGENFSADRLYDVQFIGECSIGSNSDTVTTDMGYELPTGIRHARIINSTIGDNTLVENVSAFICNADIGDNCIVNNVSVIQTTEGTTFGQGNTISVMNEAGEGNVVLYSGLTSQIAALTVLPPCLGEQYDDGDATIEARRQAKDAVRRMVMEEVMSRMPKRTLIEDNVRITDTIEITNSWITQWTEVRGAQRISETTLWSRQDNSVFVGAGAIIDGCIVTLGSSVSNNAIAKNCFIGENSTLTDGFSATDSLFFANSYMANGEACAAFCGPFSVSHHKSTLLIGGMYSFYNAGSATNFSNHAYKMGPIHYGTLERGAKTASGAYLLMPAHIGTFSVCFGKLMYHPDTRSLPFSYLIAYGDIMYLVPGRNLTTVGLYRDIRKWPKRDMRSKQSRKSIVNFDWLSPFSVGEIIQGKKILERLREASGDNVSTYNYHEYVIKTSSLRKGIKYYDIALRIFMGAVLKRHALVPPTSTVGTGKWNDLSGLLLPDSEEQQLVSDIADGTIESMDDIVDRLNAINDNYNEYRWAWAYRMILDYYGLSEITPQDAERIHTDYITARRAWITEIKKDAEKEYQLGDVEDSVLQNFVSQLDKEIDFENMTLYK